MLRETCSKQNITPSSSQGGASTGLSMLPSAVKQLFPPVAGISKTTTSPVKSPKENNRKRGKKENAPKKRSSPTATCSSPGKPATEMEDEEEEEPVNPTKRQRLSIPGPSASVREQPNSLQHKQGDGSTTSSVLDQIKLMQDNMSQMRQKAEQEEEEMKKKTAGFESSKAEIINDLEHKVGDLKSSKRRLLKKVEKKEKEMKQKKASFESSKAEMQKKINNLEHKVGELESSKSQMRQKAEQEEEEMKKKTASFESSKAEMQKKISNLEHKVGELESSKSQMRQKAEQDEEEMKKKKASFESSKAEMQKKISNLEHKVGELESSKSQMRQNAEQEEEEMKKKTASFESSKAEMQNKINDLEKEKNKLKAKVGDLEPSQMRKKAEAKVSSFLQEKGKVDTLQRENDTLMDALTDMRETINSLARQNDMLAAELQNMEAYVQNSEHTLYERQESIKSLLQKNAALDAIAKDQENYLYDYEQFTCSYDQGIEERMESMERENSILQDKVKELEGTKSKLLKDYRYRTRSWEALRNTLYSSSYQLRFHETNGRALIFNNIHFTTMEYRTDAEGDTQKLEEAFESLQVNIKVTTHQNLNLSEMLDVLQDEADKDHTDEDFFICCIMTHGSQGKVFTSDGYSVDILNILSYFKGNKCPSLKGKPKLFFIQACQGDKHQIAAIAGNHFEPDANINNPSPSKILPYLSTEADFFLALATVPGYVAYRGPGEEGADFVNVLAKVLTEHGKSQDMMNIMTIVSRELNEKYKHSPFCCTTLRHKLFFNQILL